MNVCTSGRLAVAVATAAFALTACSGGGTAQVASLGDNSSPESTGHGGSSAAAQSGGVTRLLNQWAACERASGDPQQTDPTVDSSGVIYITTPQAGQAAGNVHELAGACSQYLSQAQNELRAANPVSPAPDAAVYLKFVSCIRTNGVPDYPYPTGDTTDFIGSGVDPTSPLVVRVSQLCGKELNLPTWWVNGTAIPGTIEVHAAGQAAAPTPPACIYYKVDPCSGDTTKSADSGTSGAGFGYEG
jgi:hypothetical protein